MTHWNMKFLSIKTEIKHTHTHIYIYIVYNFFICVFVFYSCNLLYYLLFIVCCIYLNLYIRLIWLPYFYISITFAITEHLKFIFK